MKKILVLIDHSQNKIGTASWDALAMGQRLAPETGSSLHALVVGSGLRTVADELAGKELDSICRVESPLLETYNPDAYVFALKEILGRLDPWAVLMGHTYQNIDMAPRLAIRVNSALVSDCVGYRRNGDEVLFVRQMFRNKLNAEVRLHSNPPWLVMVQSGSFAAEGVISGNGSVQDLEVDLSECKPRRKQLEKVAASGKATVDLTKAEVIVGVGRGIKSADNLKIVEELAKALRAELGASRPVVDSDWLDRSRQIGSSGQSVSPRLYVACGISGAIQHVVGIKGARCSVAINTDPNAPIFNVVDYGIVGDLLEVVPALTRKLREEGQS